MKNPKILHCLSALDDGLSSQLCRRLIAQLGPKLDHTILIASDVPDVTRHRIRADFPIDFPQLDGKPAPGRLLKLAQATLPYDLVLTYDYGALNMAMAHTAFSQAFGLPPLIHHEFGFGEGDQRELTGRRNWYRRIALGRASGLVVPSERLEGLALTTWHQPIGRVRHIAPGLEVAHKSKKTVPEALRGLIKREGEQWIGTLGKAGKSNDWLRALRALEQLPENWQLVIACEGPHLAEVRERAVEMELSHRVHLPGKVEDEPALLGLLDIYLDLETSDAFPFNSLRAMGAGLPIVGFSSDDLSQLVGEPGANYLVEAKSPENLPEALLSLAQDVLSRTRAGNENLARARDRFAEKTMIERLKRLYANALGREL
jgi:glycosyltransferase involved in cell wall biosynthesis